MSLRLLLARMLAPEVKDRPTSLDVAIELEHLCVAFAAQQQLTVGPVPMGEPSSEPGPTRQIGIALTAPMRVGHDVTDPNLVAPVPTAPGQPPWPEPARRTPLPLPPILDPAVTVTVSPVLMRHPTLGPIPKVMAAEETKRIRSDDDRTARLLAAVTEDVAVEAAAARAELQIEPTARIKGVTPVARQTRSTRIVVALILTGLGLGALLVSFRLKAPKAAIELPSGENQAVALAVVQPPPRESESEVQPLPPQAVPKAKAAKSKRVVHQR